MFELNTTNEIKKIIAKRIKQERLKQQKTQEEFALKAGIKLSTYKTFEKSAKGTFDNFLLILSAFGKIGQLENILLESTAFSAKDAVLEKEQNKQTLSRQRVKHPKGYVKQVGSNVGMFPSTLSIISKGNNILNTIKSTKKENEDG